MHGQGSLRLAKSSLGRFLAVSMGILKIIQKKY